MHAIDLSQTVEGRVHDILTAGYHGILRYISPNTAAHPSKRLSRSEATEIHSVPGMRIGLVWEAGFPTSPEYFSAEQGHRDASDCLAWLEILGVPQSVPCFINSADYDASPADIDGVITASQTAVHEAFSSAGRRVGVYGSGLFCEAMLRRGLCHYTWLDQSTGHAGHAAWIDYADIIQCPSSTVAGLPVDLDVVVNEAVLW